MLCAPTSMPTMSAGTQGWSTVRVPTFPNARYVFGRQEYAHWQAKAATSEDEVQRLVFHDSVLPCMEAGQAVLVDDGYELDGALRIEAAPGHTVGHAIVRARGGGKTALFIGDVMHSPLQVLFPDTNHAICEIPEQSRASRRRILAEAAESGHLLVPGHFPPPFLGRVTPVGDAFIFVPGL